METIVRILHTPDPVIILAADDKILAYHGPSLDAYGGGYLLDLTRFSHEPGAVLLHSRGGATFPVRHDQCLPEEHHHSFRPLPLLMVQYCLVSGGIELFPKVLIRASGENYCVYNARNPSGSEPDVLSSDVYWSYREPGFNTPERGIVAIYDGHTGRRIFRTDIPNPANV